MLPPRCGALLFLLLAILCSIERINGDVLASPWEAQSVRHRRHVQSSQPSTASNPPDGSDLDESPLSSSHRRSPPREETSPVVPASRRTSSSFAEPPMPPSRSEGIVPTAPLHWQAPPPRTNRPSGSLRALISVPSGTPWVTNAWTRRPRLRLWGVNGTRSAPRRPTGTQEGPPPKRQPPTRLEEWMAARCGPDGHAIWVFEGTLQDPLTGRPVAAVEGVELIRQIATSSPSCEPEAKQLHTSLPLQACRSLQDVDDYAHATTVVSRKLFCYRPLVEEHRKLSFPFGVLREFQLRPNSPTRRIPLDQAVNVYDTATTFVQTNSGGRQGHEQWSIMSESPDGKTILSPSATVRAEDSSKLTEVAMTMFARPHHAKHPLPASWPGTRDTPSAQATSVQPARSSLISFGASPEPAKFGARESYHYTYEAPRHAETARWKRHFQPLFHLIGDSLPSFAAMSSWASPPVLSNTRGRDVGPCRVRYTRYGEGPVWYGAGGRLCTTELTGRRVNSLTELPTTCALVAAHCIPGFLSVHGPVEDPRQALQWFHDAHGERQLLDPTSLHDNENPLLSAGVQIWRRIRESMIVRNAPILLPMAWVGGS